MIGETEGTGFYREIEVESGPTRVVFVPVFFSLPGGRRRPSSVKKLKNFHIPKKKRDLSLCGSLY